jgi:uncharacterized membrane protein YvbJ
MKARFFCEKCGAEVNEGARACPSCGSLFTAVRCPECGFHGKPAEFTAGCPVCGYSMRTPLAKRPDSAPRHKGRPSRRLPARFYGVAAIVLAIIAVILLVVLLRGS